MFSTNGPGKPMFCLQAAVVRIGRTATLPLVERAAVSRALRLTDRRVRMRSGIHVRVLQPPAKDKDEFRRSLSGRVFRVSKVDADGNVHIIVSHHTMATRSTSQYYPTKRYDQFPASGGIKL